MEDKDPGDNLFDALTVSLRMGTRDLCPQCVLCSDPATEAPFPSLSWRLRITHETHVSKETTRLLSSLCTQTASLNKHLQGLMEGLTARVFRTYNASVTLQEQLRVLTRGE